MSKKWIIPSVITLFILVNITTFLFAQAKVTVVEKIVTVYKEANNKEATPSLSISVEKEPVNIAKVGAVKDPDYHAIDRGYYYTDNKKRQEVVRSVDIKNKTIDNYPASIESQETVEQNKSFLNFTNPQKGIERISMPEERRNPNLAGANTPIPQLPLFDTDYAVATDDGFANDGLPQLPDTA